MDLLILDGGIQAVLAALLIIVGGTVEGYGKGLSLGTEWPYPKSMGGKAKEMDAEAWHRIIATLLGINAIIILILSHGYLEITGFVLIVITALFGMGTLYVLADKVPSIVQGTHDILAYLTFFTYMLVFMGNGEQLLTLFNSEIPLHAFLFVLFLGGMTTGQRGFGKAIGYFTKPTKSSHWTWLIHVIGVLILIGTLGYYFEGYQLAFMLAVSQIFVGLFVYQFVNHKPDRPGAIVPIHQLMSVLIAWAIVFQIAI